MPLGLRKKSPKLPLCALTAVKLSGTAITWGATSPATQASSWCPGQRKPPPRWFPSSPPSLGTAAELRWSQPLQASCPQSLHLPRAPTPAAVPAAQLCPWPSLSRNPVSLSRRTMRVRCVGRPSEMCTTSTGTSSPIRTKSPSSVLFAISASRGRTAWLTTWGLTKEASPNPILAVFVGKASRGSALCFVSLLLFFSYHGISTISRSRMFLWD